MSPVADPRLTDRVRFLKDPNPTTLDNPQAPHQFFLLYADYESLYQFD